MNLIEKLERKWGGKGIPNITSVFIFTTLFGSIVFYLAGQSRAANLLANYSIFSPEAIMRGEVWRLFTWMLLPYSDLSFLGILFLICLFMLGRSLESLLGTFRMNCYFFGGWFLSTLGGMVIYWLSKNSIEIFLSPYYILLSLYLVLGLFLPEAEVRLYFVLPIKMKWMVLVYFADLLYDIYRFFRLGLFAGIMFSTMIVFAIINMLYFVYCCKNRGSIRGAVKQKKRQQTFQQQFAQPRPGAKIYHHKCAVCGRTDLDDPNLTFRYCSKCEGNKEYCQDHLFTHQHYRTM